jgi:hypothetical protein
MATKSLSKRSFIRRRAIRLQVAATVVCKLSLSGFSIPLS